MKYKYQEAIIRSNRVTIETINRPLTIQEQEMVASEVRNMVVYACHKENKEIPWIQEVARHKLVISGVYAIPLLKEMMGSPRDPLFAIEILGMIADKERAARIGYIRDTSSAPLVIDLIGKEPDAAVKTALLKIVGKYFDMLDQGQKDKLEKSLVALLTHADAGVRLQVALTLLELFPRQRPAIESALAKPDFADAAGRKLITETLAKIAKP